MTSPGCPRHTVNILYNEVWMVILMQVGDMWWYYPWSLIYLVAKIGKYSFKWVFRFGQVEGSCHDLKQKKEIMLLMSLAHSEVIQLLFSQRKKKKPIAREEVGQGGAPEPRLENFRRTDTLDEGGAHCWKGSFVGITPPPSLPAPSQCTHRYGFPIFSPQPIM